MPDDPTSDEQVSPVSGAATEPVAVVTEPVEVVTVPWEPTVPPPSAGQLGDDEGDLADDEWPIRSPRSGLRLKYPTAVLVALLIGAGGLWGGAASARPWDDRRFKSRVELRKAVRLVGLLRRHPGQLSWGGDHECRRRHRDDHRGQHPLCHDGDWWPGQGHTREVHDLYPRGQEHGIRDAAGRHRDCAGHDGEERDRDCDVCR